VKAVERAGGRTGGRGKGGCLWVAQGKSNGEVALILGISEGTVKKHLEHIFEKLGVEKRGAASVIALEALEALVA
jgi:DNA-binding CsgD family transcriptional regulator